MRFDCRTKGSMGLEAMVCGIRTLKLNGDWCVR